MEKIMELERRLGSHKKTLDEDVVSQISDIEVVSKYSQLIEDD